MSCPLRFSNTSSGMGNEWGDLKSDGSVCLPPRLFPRMDVLTPDGIYIAFNGSFVYVWLGKACDVSCLHELFGFASVDQADGTITGTLTASYQQILHSFTGAVIHAQDFGSVRRVFTPTLSAVSLILHNTCVSRRTAAGAAATCCAPCKRSSPTAAPSKW
jgi:hypothetical protein